MSRGLGDVYKRQPMCVRLAEASCGSKWMHGHATKLPAVKKAFPTYAPTFAKMGITDSMDSVALVDALTSKHVCSKKECKAVLNAVAEGDMDGAVKKMNGKTVITL